MNSASILTAETPNAAASPAPAPKVVARNVDVHYGEKHALKAVSVEVGAADFDACVQFQPQFAGYFGCLGMPTAQVFLDGMTGQRQGKRCFGWSEFAQAVE